MIRYDMFMMHCNMAYRSNKPMDDTRCFLQHLHFYWTSTHVGLCLSPCFHEAWLAFFISDMLIRMATNHDT